MSDNDNPEVPQGSQKSGNMFDRWRREAPPPITPEQERKMRGEDNSDSVERASSTTEGEEFRDAAIKLSVIQEQLCAIMESKPVDNPKPYDKESAERARSIPVAVFGGEGWRWTRSSLEGVKNAAGENAEVRFHMGPKYTPLENEGVDADRVLVVDINADDATRDAYREYAELHPDSQASTKYYFKGDGSYGKFVTLPRAMPLPEGIKVAWEPNEIQTTVTKHTIESPMTPDDFELAGQAIIMLRDRLSINSGVEPSNP